MSAPTQSGATPGELDTDAPRASFWTLDQACPT